MARLRIWLKGNEMLIRVSKATNTKTGEFLTGTDIVRLTSLKDKDGVQVANVPANLPLLYQTPGGAIPEGTYDAIGSASAEVVVGQPYTAVIEINPSGAPRAYAEAEVTVRDRDV